jgi:hypothetical protein
VQWSSRPPYGNLSPGGYGAAGYENEVSINIQFSRKISSDQDKPLGPTDYIGLNGENFNEFSSIGSIGLRTDEPIEPIKLIKLI